VPLSPFRRRLVLAVSALALLVALPACAPKADPAAENFGAILPSLPPELTNALDHFRAEGPKGWAFTQTTSGDGKELVERYDPRRRGSARWTLLSEKGAVPTEEQQQRYRDTRPAFDAASNLSAQFDRTRAALVSQDERSATYEFALKPASETDTAAAHMRARVTLDRPTGAIVRVELFNFRPFKPAGSLTIEEARTTLVYAPPVDGGPALPLESAMKVRGKRFWFRSFEQTVTSKFSDHENAAKRNDNPESPNPALQTPPSTQGLSSK
jgi:hypothetical protein